MIIEESANQRVTTEKSTDNHRKVGWYIIWIVDLDRQLL